MALRIKTVLIILLSGLLLLPGCTSPEKKIDTQVSNAATESSEPAKETPQTSTSLQAAPSTPAALVTTQTEVTTLPEPSATPKEKDAIVKRSQIEGKTAEEINKLFVRAESCLGCDYDPGKGIVGNWSKFTDITDSISAADDQGTTLSESAPTQVTAVYLTGAGSKLRIIGKSGSQFEQEMCLYIRADDNSDGVYERGVTEKCWGRVPYPFPFDITLEVGDSENLLLHSKGSVFIDEISPDGITIED